ncbi:ATP-binding protein [Caulobacter mirabilis]|uniref:histidine kinase n=1 Tax=Caulobacter mirabilis TaxID=69666 RepID=A0A2D2B229_9CAUL|nr:ATP-binding protein [Caulobacter mirabilis]ATQ44267.1 hybrid sensor histidine kinase/response regulator [Caulobacter mirabilis]
MTRTSASERQRWAAMAEDLAGVGYWWMDAASQAIRWSPSMFRIFGFGPGAEPPLDMAMARIHPDDRAAAEANLAQALAGQASASVLRVVWPSGEVRSLEGRVACQMASDGRVAAVYGAVVDLTAHVRAERELAEARDAAQAAAAVKAEFLANMSHELRTPLTSVLGFSALLSERCSLDEEAQSYVDRIASASRALLATVNDILDFSKLEAGQVEIKPRPVDVGGLARETLELFSSQAQEKGLALELAVDAAMPGRLVVDPDRLRQMLLNLIGNAVKFTQEGAVSMALRHDPFGGMLEVVVRDTGPGLDEAQRARLFQRFSQVDAGSTRQNGGTGLGLAICKGLAEAMGGGIEVRSRPGVGSAFRFRIAAPAAVEEAEAAQRLPVDGPAKGVRLLIVDDHRVNRELAAAMLAPWAPLLVEVGDGESAVAAAEGQPFDLILMDIRMPGRLDGPAAAEHIRSRNGPNRDTPILAFSADADAEALLATGAPFDGVIGKPILAAELVAAVARWTRARHAA